MEYNFSNVLLILLVKYFYNRLRFKVVIDKSCMGHFFPDTVYVDVHRTANVVFCWTLMESDTFGDLLVCHLWYGIHSMVTIDTFGDFLGW